LRVLYLYCHPLPESFHAALLGRALDALRAAEHEVDLLDLYAEGFDPVMSAQGRRAYHDTSVNQASLERHVERLRAAEGIVVQFPVWSFGPPAMLKGYFDRLLMPGVGFDLSDPTKVRRLLGFRRLAGIASYGQPWSRALVMGDPPRKAVMRYLRLMAKNHVRAEYHALYHMNVASDAKRAAFMDRVGAAMARF
jgi:putative NADPH-quinone reductase